MDTRDGENLPLLGGGRESTQSFPERAKYLTCLAIAFVGCLGLIISISINYQYSQSPSNVTTIAPDPESFLVQSTSGDGIPFSVFSLMVWGSPSSFGVEDKSLRMSAIGEWIAKDSDHDVYLLNDLWMRPDHMNISAALPSSYTMTKVNDFADSNCDGVLAPEFCSGLAIISKHPIKNMQFLSFTDHGDLFWDYEYFLRRGAGMVTLELSPGHTVDVVVTSLASIDYNYWYREHQTSDLLKFITHSTANHLIVAGDFNVDSRDNEDTFKLVKNTLTNVLSDDQLLDPSYATLGNKDNTYTDKGQNAVVYDYIWYKNQDITLEEFKVLNLKTPKEEISLSDHQALSAKFKLN